jgi:hypothetical protein
MISRNSRSVYHHSADSTSTGKLQKLRLGCCGYREFRPHLKQYPFGTLIADLIDELVTVPTIAGTYRIGSVCLAQSKSSSKCRKSVSRKNPVLDQQQFGRLDQGEAAFPPQEGNHRCNWLAPAKRRVADIGGVILRPEESLSRAPGPAVPLPSCL